MCTASLVAVLGFGLHATFVIVAGTRPLWVLQIVTNLFFVVHFGRQVYSAWHPLVRISATAIASRFLGQAPWTEIALEQVAGTRWQDSFDLRLIRRGGVEHALPWRQLGRRDRAPLVRALSDLFRRNTDESIAPKR